VFSRFPQALTNEEASRLQLILMKYVRARMAYVYPITWPTLKSRLERISEKSSALLEELSDWAIDYEIAWHKISRQSERSGEPSFTHDEVYPVISRLAGSSTLALAQAERDRQAGDKGSHRAPWIALVQGLQDLFEAAGARATAPKGYRHGGYADPSPFVTLVWTVMNDAIPKKLREYTQSPGAMAYQINLVLSRRVRSSRGRERSFRKLR
jgi:hypothetical protein